MLSERPRKRARGRMPKRSLRGVSEAKDAFPNVRRDRTGNPDPTRCDPRKSLMSPRFGPGWSSARRAFGCGLTGASILR